MRILNKYPDSETISLKELFSQDIKQNLSFGAFRFRLILRLDEGGSLVFISHVLQALGVNAF